MSPQRNVGIQVIYSHQEVGSFCTLFSSQKGCQASEKAAKKDSLYGVITFCSRDGPLLHRQCRRCWQRKGLVLMNKPALALCVSPQKSKTTHQELWKHYDQMLWIACLWGQLLFPQISEIELLRLTSLFLVSFTTPRHLPKASLLCVFLKNF